MKRFFKPAIAVFMATASVFGASAADPYKVRVQLSDDEEGAMVYMINFDTKEKIDSVIVADKVAMFKGSVDEPLLARFILDGQPFSTFILESGSIVVDPRKGRVFGSMLNDKYYEYETAETALADRYRATDDVDAKKKIFEEYSALFNNTMTENMDNPIGYYLFIQNASSMDPTEFDGWIEKYPDLGNYKRVAMVKDAFAKKAATAVGQMFQDFEVTYDGKTERLSDYVGKGKYVLVDYWASWCGPCIRQIPVLKELLEEFGDKGLEVLGVAVWDEPAATLEAIKSHGITWPCIINAQSIPTDIYGINAIPCIILYGPDGKILSRDKQSNDLKADVRAAFAGTLK